MGDLLISGPSSRDAAVVIPTLGRAPSLKTERDDREVVWLAQKTSIITDKLAVGWSGAYESAKYILRAMNKYFNEGPITLDAIEKFLATIEYEKQKSVKLVGFYATDKGISHFGLNSKILEMPVVNQTRAAGSGVPHFFGLVKSLEVSSGTAFESMSPDSAAIACALTLSSVVIGEEIGTGVTLKSFYGGGIEIVFWNEGKFEKLSDKQLQAAVLSLAEDDEEEETA